jgi:hypothetical protein
MAPAWLAEWRNHIFIADFGDGTTNGADLAIFLSNWGPC